MAAPPFSIAELDGGQRRLRHSLVSPVFSAHHRELYASRQSGSSQKIRMIERETSVANPQHVRDTERCLDLARDPVLPLYSIMRGPHTEWNVQVGYDQGDSPQTYPFRSRDDVYEFQKLLTTYEPVHNFENVRVCVTFKNKGKLRVRDSTYVGTGEIQLWKPEPKAPVTTPSSVSSDSTSGHLSHNSSTSTAFRRPMRLASIQTNPDTGDSVVVLNAPQPPLLVAFLKDEDDDGGYTMLKARGEISSSAVLVVATYADSFAQYRCFS